MILHCLLRSGTGRGSAENPQAFFGGEVTRARPDCDARQYRVDPCREVGRVARGYERNNLFTFHFLDIILICFILFTSFIFLLRTPKRDISFIYLGWPPRKEVFIYFSGWISQRIFFIFFYIFIFI
jgi:hypothetical protein